MKTARLILAGVIFDIDPQRECFIEVANPENVISFSCLKKEKYSYVLNFDSEYKHAAQQNADQNSSTFFKIQIPNMMLLENFIVEPEFANLFNKASYRQSWGLLLFDEVIQQRLEGKLPELVIGPDTYWVDNSINQFRSVSGKWPDIAVNRLKVPRYAQSYDGFFDTETRELLAPNKVISGLGSTIAYLEIPTSTFIDPIGLAIRCNEEPTAFLPHYGQQIARHVAKLRPLTDLTQSQLKSALKLFGDNRQHKNNRKGIE